MNRFFVLEGLDSSGKSTQVTMLENFLKEHSIQYKYIHFPRTDQPGCYGEVVSMFLRGEFGKDLNPYLTAFLFAADRNDAKEMIKGWLNEGYLVFADRYYLSNMAFQGAKILSPDEKIQFRIWLKKLEIDCNRIPLPLFSLYLNVPFTFIEKSLRNRTKDQREYLAGKEDIHENDLLLQALVDSEYKDLLNLEANFFEVNCIKTDDEIISPKEVHETILDYLKKFNYIDNL